MKNYIFDRKADDFLRDTDGDKLFFYTNEGVRKYLVDDLQYSKEYVDKNFFIVKEVKILHSEHIPIELSEEDDKINVEQWNRKFELSETQIKKFIAWQESLSNAYFGVDSNGITIEFPQCSIGIIVKAKRREGEEIDLTDWNNF